MLVPEPPAQRPQFATLALAVAAACSVVPPASFPPHADHHVAADFVVPAAGRLLLPASTRELVVRELAVDPPPSAESFDANGRWFLFPPGTAVHVRCRLRAYADAAGNVPTIGEILVGAARIEPLEGP